MIMSRLAGRTSASTHEKMRCFATIDVPI